jgi:hypothetical protein
MTTLSIGLIKIVDRRKYMVKLANGEFVAPSELEAVFAQSPLIAQIYVHGDLLKDFLVNPRTTLSLCLQSYIAIGCSDCAQRRSAR